jgi:hypothetical protein
MLIVGRQHLEENLHNIKGNTQSRTFQITRDLFKYQASFLSTTSYLPGKKASKTNGLLQFIGMENVINKESKYENENKISCRAR